ncbi:MAG TPA: YjcZ family sporulation protein [Bacilli bacterium]
MACVEPVATAGIFDNTGAILVLFILLVIILRSCWV